MSSATYRDSFSNYRYMWRNGGQLLEDPGREPLRMADAIAIPESTSWIPKIVNETITEAVEPLLVAMSLFETVPYKPGVVVGGQVVGALGDNFAIPEEGEYPEVRVQVGPGTQITSTGKYGLAIRFTEEILRYASYNVVQTHVRAASRALARFKEAMAWNLLSSEGVVTHDNKTPNQSRFGVTQGRSLTGAANGTLTADDVFEVFAHAIENGYNIDTLCVHPLSWLMLVRDPILRYFALHTDRGGSWFNQWQGQPGKPDQSNTMGGKGLAGGKNLNVPGELGTPAAANAFSQVANSAMGFPSYWYTPFRVLVSPMVPFDVTNNCTDMIFISGSAGYYLDDEALATEEWKDPEHDIQKIKMRERYSLQIREEGQNVFVMKNVKVDSNSIVLPMTATIASSGTIGAITRTTATLP